MYSYIYIYVHIYIYLFIYIYIHIVHIIYVSRWWTHFRTRLQFLGWFCIPPVYQKETTHRHEHPSLWRVPLVAKLLQDHDHTEPRCCRKKRCRSVANPPTSQHLQLPPSPDATLNSSDLHALKRKHPRLFLGFAFHCWFKQGGRRVHSFFVATSTYLSNFDACHG